VLSEQRLPGLIRRPQRGFDMDYCVQLAFDNVNAPEVAIRRRPRKVAEGLGCKACGARAGEIGPALEEAKKMMASTGCGGGSEVHPGAEGTNISMGTDSTTGGVRGTGPNGVRSADRGSSRCWTRR